jgi:hydroxymethylpyrimidine pyrophosphatase-like HAD family hydrolase
VDRLFLHKLLAGTVAMATARTNLRHPQLVDRYDDFNRDFVKAWNFLTIQAARLCGGFCRRPESVRWGPSVAVLDVDGVLDRRIFGFPTTTAAGVQALSLLHAHDRAIAINSARSVLEIREYCKAYGLAGGVAEYGSYVWDATVGKGRCLVGPEALEQLELLRRELRRLPGAFVNDTYEYSIRAYTFEEGGPVPLPTLTIQALLARLRLDRLAFHQTSIDSAIVAKESDKGRGLEALLDLVGMVGADTVAVGDSEPDLAMFRAARRSFAPAQMCCGRLARLHGCKIVRRAHQAGLLEIAHAIVHPSGGRCRRCSLGPAWPRGKNIFLDLLAVADSRKPYSLLKALFDPRALQVFVE